MGTDVLLIAHFCGDFDGTGNNRFNYLAELWANNGLDVELVTSDFSHNKKKKRENVALEMLNYQVTFINEPVYTKNVSLRRLYSHAVLAHHLKNYLGSRKKPDVIYCAVPSLDVASVAASYARKHDVKFIIDVQDLWPEAFKLVHDIPLMSDLVFCPMKLKANYVYRSADEIVSVSETYLKRAMEVNSKVKEGKVVFLGTDLNKFDEASMTYRYRKKPHNEVWIAYVGTLGHSYDLTSVLDALEILMRKGIRDFRFIVMGDGPLKIKFEDYAVRKGINAWFTGRLPYGEMVGLLCVCDIAVNPIAKGAAQSIINKHGDYAAAGLPVVNTQECLEYRNLVDEYQMGLNCANDDPQDLADKLRLLLEDGQLRERLSTNSRRLAEEKFDRKRTYPALIELLK